MRQFGIISSGIWRSKRFRQLTSDLARLTYIYLHTTTHGNSAGVFIVSPEIAALEMKRGGREVREAFEELAAVGLIRYDQDEELIQIRNFFKFNGPTSRKHLAGPMRIITEALPQSPVRDAAAIELIVAMYRRAITWDRGVEARGVFFQEAATMMREMRLTDEICDPDHDVPIDVLIGLSNELLIDLPIQGYGQDHGQDHHKTTDKTKTKTTETRSDKPDTRPNGNAAKSDPPSPPADGGQSDRKGRSIPKDVEDTIKSLGAKKRTGG